MFKKVFIVSVGFFVIALAVAGYFIFYKKPTNTPIPTISTNQNTLPFGNSGTNINLTQASSTTDTNNQNQTIQLSKLMQISSNPVAGATFYTHGSTTIVRYDEKGTAHVTDVNLLTGTTSRVSNTTIATVYESVWLNGATTAIVRYPNASEDTIVSYSTTLIPGLGTSTLKSLQGTYLPDNIESLAASPDGKKIAYVVTTGTGERVLTTNPNGSGSATLMDSSFGEWTVSWPNINTIALTTKPAAGINGYMYLINTKTKVMQKVIDAVPGLTTLVSPDATAVAYSDDENNLSIYTIKSGSHIIVAQTLAEKCVWSQKQAHTIYCAVPSITPSGFYPDAWYQGRVSFTDVITKIDTTTGSNQVIADLKANFGADIDATNIALSPDENYLIFTNKKDYTLWSLKLGQ